MTDLLAIVGPPDADDQLLDAIVHRRPRRVTVLIEEPTIDWSTDDTVVARELRDRMANLLAAIERSTGATVVGMVGSREQLRGWRFDRIIGDRAAGDRVPVAA